MCRDAALSPHVSKRPSGRQTGGRAGPHVQSRACTTDVTVRGDLVMLTNMRELTGLSTPLEIRTSRTLTPSAACPNGTPRLSHTSQREREWFCGPTGGVQIAGALGGQVRTARTGSALNEHRKRKEQPSHPHVSATLGVSAPGSHCPGLPRPSCRGWFPAARAAPGNVNIQRNLG